MPENEIPDDGLDLPDVDAEVLHHSIQDSFSYPVSFRIAFVGLGQGGGRMVETFYKLGYRRVCAINSAHADLKDLDPNILKLDLGTGGAGQDMKKGRQFLERRKEDAWDLLTRAVGEDADYLVVCASLGGGTGSGGADLLISLCREYMESKERSPQRVGAMVSLPNPYEGQRTSRNAVLAFNNVYRLKPSPFVIIDNKRVGKLYRKGASEFFDTCNSQIGKLFHLFNRMAGRKGLCIFDQGDYATLLDSGIITFGASPVKTYQTPADISECIRQHLSDTVLAEVDLSKAKLAGCIFLGGERILKQVPLDYFGEGFSMLGRIMAPDNTIFRGVYEGASDDLRCYTMLSTLPPPSSRLQELGKEARLNLPSGGVAEYLGIDD